MEIADIILIPVYVFVALLIIKILHIDAWIDWFLKIFKIPNYLERRVTELENRIKKLESNN
jgi:hypothetical protein